MMSKLRACRAATGLFALSLALIARTLDAQGLASVSGTVRDASGGVLPGVSVSIADVKSGTLLTAVSDQQGRYSFPGLAPGGYRLTTELGGFDPANADVTIAAAQSATKDFTLKVTSFFENVTVTAQKRDQEILDVPMAITALSATTLEQQGVTNLREIAGSIPGLSMVETGPGQHRAQIRGISSPLNLPTVGTYLDEASITTDAAGGATDVRMLDLDRVEVLRGPQGTLYGAGSMGGTIKYMTKSPILDAPSFQFDSAAGAVKDGSGLYRTSLVANLPVVKGKFGIRAAVAAERSPGWVDYPALNHQDANEGESTTFRIKGLWVANTKFSATLLFQRQNSDYDGQPYADEKRTAPYSLDQPLHETSMLTTMVLNYDARRFTILSSTGYLDQANKGTYDFSPLYVPIYQLFGFPAGLVKTVAWKITSETDMLTQEIRFASKGDTPFTWTAGVFFRDYTSNGTSDGVATPDPLPFPPYTGKGENKSRSSAVFGEANYAATKTFTTTLGLRYSSDTRKTSGITGSFGPTKPNPDHSGTFTSVNPRAVLSYRPSDGKLFYMSAAKGFRSGGFNNPPPGCTIPQNYDAETLWTYEGGSSASLANGRFVVQGAVYRNSWTDMQTLILCPGQPFALVANAGKATGTGVDMQVTVTPVRPLRLTLSGNYGDSKYDDTAVAHKQGDRVDYVPNYNLSVAADWSFHVADKRPGQLHVDYQETGAYVLNFRQVGLDPLKSDVISGLNARLSLTLGKVELSVYGQNLLDENGAVQPAIVFGGTLVPPRPQPRTIGAGFGLRF
jgi:iron complex outermembrane receptor protein